MEGTVLTNRRSRYYQVCSSGTWSESMLVPDDKICYLGTLFPSTYCGEMPPQPECSFSGYKCIDNNGILTDTSCTSQYVFFFCFIILLELCYVKMDFYHLQ